MSVGIRAGGQQPQGPPVVAQAVEQSAHIVPALCQPLEAAGALPRPAVVIGIVEAQGGQGGLVGHRPYPFASLRALKGDKHAFACTHRHLLQRLPAACAVGIHLHAELHGFRAAVPYPGAAVLPSGKQEGLRGHARLHLFLAPHGTFCGRGPQAVHLPGLHKPEIGVRLPGAGYASLGLALVEKFLLCRVVAAKHQFVAPPAEVAHHLQVGRARTYARTVCGRECAGKAPEHAVHGHQIVVLPCSHIADAWPLGVPSVCPVVAVAGLGQAVEGPSLLPVPNAQDYRLVVPSRRPYRVGVGVGVATDAPGAGHLGKLVPAHHFPVLSVPFGQHAGLYVKPAQCFLAAFSVVAEHQHALSRIQALSVHAGQHGACRCIAGVVLALWLQVAVAVAFVYVQRVHVHLVDALLHGAVIDFPGRMEQMACIARVPSWHCLVGYRAHGACRVDGIRADEQLTTFGMDHAVGGCAADAVLIHGLLHVRRHGIQFVR